MSKSEKNKAPRSRFRFDQRKMSAHYRRVCSVVMDLYTTIKGTLGQAQAVDYSRMTGGCGAKFKDNGFAFKCADYMVDIEHAASHCLSPREFAIFKYVMTHDSDIPVQSVEYLEIRSKLGRMFKARGLYPAKKYFDEVRVAYNDKDKYGDLKQKVQAL